MEVTLALPPLPQGTQTTISVKSNSLDLSPTFGGPVQRASRLGDKWSITIDIRPMKYVQALGLTTILSQAAAEKVLMSWPQGDLQIGTPGTPLVNGANQLGNSLIADGFTANYPIRQGQYFSIIVNGVRYLHRARTAVTANASGQVTIPIFPMLRKSPTDNAVLEFADPKIEGWVQDAGKQAWTISLVQAVGTTFTIVEGQ